MGDASIEEDIVGSTMTGSAAKMANLINAAADKQKISSHKIKIDPEEMSTAIKALALDYGGDIVRMPSCRDIITIRIGEMFLEWVAVTENQSAFPILMPSSLPVH